MTILPITVKPATLPLPPVNDAADTDATVTGLAKVGYEHPERFRILRVDAPPELRRPEYRLTLDTPDDLALFAAIVEHFPGAGFALDLREVVALLDREPRLADMNRHIVQKTAR